MFVCLNPSTADDEQDDPTVRRCIAYSKAWGYSSYVMTNLFAIRATDPRVMLAAEDPIGPENDRYLIETARQAAVVVAAWGKHGAHRDRATAVQSMLPGLHYLKLNGDGSPAHPLYLPKKLTPIEFNG